MVEKIQYRWDFIGLSTDIKPTPETNDRVANGSTFYCSDNSKLYVWYKDQWYEKTVSGGGGGTSNFNQLSNRPKYNGATMTGDTNIPEVKTYSDFTGTDGTAAGTSGLVPAPATTDAGKFLKADGTWDTAGGGGGVTPVQTTGTSTTDVMSQKATTDMVYSGKSTSVVTEGGAVYIGSKNANQQVYSDPTTTDLHYRYFWALPGDTSGTAHTVAPGSGTINIGGSQQANTESNTTVGFASKSFYGQNTLIGYQAQGAGSCVCAGESALSSSIGGVALGRGAQVNANNVGSVALGTNARTSRGGEVYVGTNNTSYGYNNTNYRVIGGVHDGQLAQDAVTVAQVNATIDAINTALSTNIPHIGAAS